MTNTLCSASQAAAASADGCNETTLTMTGTSSLSTDINAVATAQDWSLKNINEITAYTDGYKIEVEQTFVSDGATGRDSGMCFSAGHSTSETGTGTASIDGAVCHTAKGKTNTQIEALGHKVRWFTQTDWSDATFDMLKGVK